MTTDDILLGIALVVVLAVGSQLAARRLRIPAIVVLLPAGFVAGIATNDVDPTHLLGDLYQPFVSLAVGVILFEAGLSLSVGELAIGAHKVVVRLVVVGVSVTCACVALTVALLFAGMSNGVALVTGAILVVSGPTVVLPLLAFIRPSSQVRSTLKWEGVLVDPVGALLGVLLFNVVNAGWRPGDFMTSISVGLGVGLVSAVLLWLLLREVHLNEPRMAILATLMMVVAAVVAADLLREDSGFVAATVMGIAFGNQHLIDPARRIDVSLTKAFQETLVQLLVGVLFVLIAASVSPSDVADVLPKTLVLVTVMALLVRPAVVALATWRSSLTVHERGFVAWMAPRGIVAGATASAFGLSLEKGGHAGADRVLPIVFVVIFATVVVYGLTAPLVARLLGVAGQARGLVLVVGGHPWALDLAAAFKQSGLGVRMWTGSAADREAALGAGIEVERGRIMLDAVSREAELEELSEAFLLTASDDFNLVAAADLRAELGHGHVFRVAPDPEEPHLLPAATDAGIFGNSDLTYARLDDLFAAGARIVARAPGETSDLDDSATNVPLAAVTADGRLNVAADGRAPDTRGAETLITLALHAT
jgi:NhaP-type Na+/H+ or K+/H+ antiporter